MVGCKHPHMDRWDLDPNALTNEFRICSLTVMLSWHSSGALASNTLPICCGNSYT